MSPLSPGTALNQHHQGPRERHPENCCLGPKPYSGLLGAHLCRGMLLSAPEISHKQSRPPFIHQATVILEKAVYLFFYKRKRGLFIPLHLTSCCQSQGLWGEAETPCLYYNHSVYLTSVKIPLLILTALKKKNTSPLASCCPSSQPPPPHTPF